MVGLTDIDEGFGIKKESIDVNAERLKQTGSVFKNGDETISQLFSNNGYSQLDSALTSSMYGIDIFGTGSPAQQTHEQYGLTFFTRPMLNLSYDNITTDRTLTALASGEPLSIGRYVRALLDPIGQISNSNKGSTDSNPDPSHTCPLVDPTNVFMPLLSNTVESLSGWQDPILDTYQSPSGLKKESWSIGDSSTKVYGIMQLSSSFRNTRGNILGYLFHVWQTYIGLEYEGIIDPHPLFIRNFTVDYQTRIYRIILDQTRTFVQEIIACGAAFPLVNNAGRRGDFNREEVVNKEVDTYSQTWQTMGAFYYDPGMMYDFNLAASMLKDGFQDPETRKKNYRRLWPKEYRLFTYLAFPQINVRTSRLEWWVSNLIHQRVLGKVSYRDMNLDD